MILASLVLAVLIIAVALYCRRSAPDPIDVHPCDWPSAPYRSTAAKLAEPPGVDPRS